MTNVLFLLTARGGSKGVPGKNLREISGLSPIGWKARAAQQAIYHLTTRDYDHTPFTGRLVISTDSYEIAAEARKHGVEVPFMRPPELASDTAMSADVVRHALTALSEPFDAVVLLEPSAPFATPLHLVEAFDKFHAEGALLVVGMKHTEPHTSFIAEVREDHKIEGLIGRMRHYGADTRRQARKPEWTMNGALYVFNPEVLSYGGDIYQIAPPPPPDENGMIKVDTRARLGYLMDHWHSIEIDTPRDFEMAEYAVERGYVTVPEAPSMWDKLLGKIRL